MRSPLLLVFLMACNPTPPRPTAPLSVPGGAPVLDLDRLDFAASLPSGSDEVAFDGTFELGDLQAARGPVARRLGATLMAPLPFDPGPAGDRHAPPGMRVEVDGTELPYLMGRGAAGWRIHEGALLLVLDSVRRPERVLVHHPTLARRLARLEPVASGLAPASFVRHACSLGDETREGLLLPAPATLTWRLSPPEGAHLKTATAMVDDGLRGPPPRGARLVWEVVSEEGVIEVGQRDVPGTTLRFEPWELDLSAFAGQEITLRLRAEALDAGGRRPLPFVAHPVLVGVPRAEGPRRVVWIGLDTTRPDHLGLYGYARDTTPLLDAWSDTATVFEDAVAPAPRTRPSFRSALTGRRPLDAVGAPTVLATLDEAGFATAGIVANVHLTPRFGFSQGADRWLLDPSADASEQVDRALAWLQESSGRDSALFLHFMDPHLRYGAPGEDRDRFVTDPDPDLPDTFNKASVARWDRSGELTERRKAHIQALYDGEVRYLDRELGRLLAALDTLPGRTLVVLHSDHGEEFWEHGGFEHNHTLKPEVVDAALMVRTPDQPSGARVSAPVTLADLVPTVLEELGLPPLPTEGRSLSPLLDDPAARWPERDLGVAHLMYDTERWAVRSRGHTYVLHTGSGQEELYDRAADPGEHRDLVPTGASPAAWRASLAAAHGVDVGPGWRAEVVLAGEPITWALPRPARSAGVLDPEVFLPHRANQVWGESPAVRPADVAEVVLSEDGGTLTVTPGPVGRGTLWVRFDEPVPPGGTLASGGVSRELDGGGPRLGFPGLHRLDVREGTVLVPPVGEVERLAAVLGALDTLDPGTQTMLEDLGYLNGVREDPRGHSGGASPRDRR